MIFLRACHNSVIQIVFDDVLKALHPEYHRLTYLLRCCKF